MTGDRRVQSRLSYRRGIPSLRWGDTPHSVAPYVPTPLKVVRKMLSLANVGPEDVVYDLGCGDGRILFTAIEEFDAVEAVGYDINSALCESLKMKIENKGLGDRIRAVNGNFFLADLSPASVVTLYLTTSGNSKLRPKLEEELGEGSRVVSHDFPIYNWATDRPAPGDHYNLGSHKIYLYNLPDAYQRKMKALRSADEASRWKRLRDLLLRENAR
ncbi:MAG: methyltransferase domain-containing protein [Candidatus Bathyarchaeota archaeon]|nr:MAG: methyltransferase domain-containing protein [Candidatus Bathyarchaeota archaeon]